MGQSTTAEPSRRRRALPALAGAGASVLTSFVLALLGWAAVVAGLIDLAAVTDLPPLFVAAGTATMAALAIYVLGIPVGVSIEARLARSRRPERWRLPAYAVTGALLTGALTSLLLAPVAVVVLSGAALGAVVGLAGAAGRIAAARSGEAARALALAAPLVLLLAALSMNAGP